MNSGGVVPDGERVVPPPDDYAVGIEDALGPPFFVGDGVTLFHGDSTQVRAWRGAVMVTDPPYGIGYHTGSDRQEGNPRSIANDGDTEARDTVLERWRGGDDRPALMFGSWKAPRPAGTRMVLIWDQGDALGMGDLSLPWKPSWQEVYVLGSGFTGRRDGAVLRHPPVQSMAKNGRVHPNEKPVALLSALIAKCPPGVVIDPFAGSGSTLLAARLHGRQAIGVELDERYCEITAKRLAQGDLFAGSGTRHGSAPKDRPVECLAVEPDDSADRGAA